MKPTPVHIVHFPRALEEVLFLSNTDRLITSHNSPNNSQQDNLVTMTAHEILNIVIPSFVIIRDLYT